MQLIGQHLRGGEFLDTQHDHGVEIAGYLAGFGAAADLRFHVGPSLRIGGHLETGAAGFAQEWHELVTDELIELIGMHGNRR